MMGHKNIYKHVRRGEKEEKEEERKSERKKANKNRKEEKIVKEFALELLRQSSKDIKNPLII